MGKSNHAKRFLALTVTARKTRHQLMPHAQAAREALAGLRAYREQEALGQMQLDRAARRLELPALSLNEGN